MKRLLISLSIVPLLAGCSTTNITKLALALSKDQAAVRVRVMTPYGSIEYDRANPGTNNITVGPNGITSVK